MSLNLLVLILLFLFDLGSAQNFPWANTISRTGWSATADSFQTGFEPSRILDNNGSSFWLTTNTPLPHQIVLDLQQRHVVTGISYRPRADGQRIGTITEHTLDISDNGETWRTVAEGFYMNDTSIKFSFFTASTARYIRLTARRETLGNQLTSVAELHVYTPVPAVAVADFVAVPPSQGRWGPTIQLPITPAAASITTDNNVVFWSADRMDNFPGGTGSTFTATYNPTSGSVQSFHVTNIRHDMFCPGSSIDDQGRVIVTGGNDEARTSIYSPSTGQWTAAAAMSRPRGYHSTATMSDGRIFAIGGSWSGERGNKHGEVYSIAANTWTRLDGCNVSRILTNDRGGTYQADNHAWLFAWKQNLIFHAGPSSRMTWFNATGRGSWREAGLRGSDPDSMSGIVAMYDAEAGLIVSAGGGPHYSSTPTTRNTHIIQLDDNVNTLVNVTRVADMAYARAYHNSVILPNGQVVVIGGQSQARSFQDTDAILPAEVFDPATRSWTAVAPVSIPRNYHSVALLLPDARVISSGGGLCGTGCQQNHPDAQIWTPPYLLNSDGSAATRPRIVSVSGETFQPGATLQVTTDVASTFALIRYGSTTHTVNTDQRRIRLRTTASGLTYTAVLPSDPGVLLNGPWMLFALSSSGVPSVSRAIRITVP
ncbi:hypothetical protein S40288_03973 [Stachybotrys chartarum IBT 40288]|nr:hypothetical protein S40288_03973 [Stachybotrys chartarum IBT 40288]